MFRKLLLRLRYCRNEVVKRVRDRKRVLTFIIHERVLLISDGEQKENENLIFNNGNREGGEGVEIVLVSFQLLDIYSVVIKSKEDFVTKIFQIVIIQNFIYRILRIIQTSYIKTDSLDGSTIYR